MANKVFSTESWTAFTNKFKAMIASLRGLSEDLDTKASVIDPITVSAIASGSSSADWSSCTELVNYIRKHQSAPSTLVVNASGTVYTLMLTGSEWSTGSGSGTFAYRGLGINSNSGKPFIIEVLLETADSTILADILNNAEVALQAAITSLQSTVSSVQDVLSGHADVIEANARSIVRAEDTANQALSKANTNSANFAPRFSITTGYSVGDYVTYNNVLYRCTTDHTAGAWDASHFTQVTVADEVVSLQNDLSEASYIANNAQTTANSAASAASNAQTTADSALSKANTNAGNITSLTSAIDAVRNRSFQNNANFATTFVTTKSYAVGEYVTYNSVLYRCTTAHSAGAWVASHFTQVTVGEDMYRPFTTVTGKARCTVYSSSTGGVSITLDSSMTIPAGTYWAECQISAVDGIYLTDDNNNCSLDMLVSPFTKFTGLDYAQPWFKSGTFFTSKNLIHIPEQITVAGGTEIGYLWDVKVRSGEQCEFYVSFTFTRLSTH